MIKNKRVLALIPARGGSKGIKHKNIVDLAGKPLIAYSIDAAKKSRYIDDIVVSTDDESIAEVAKEYGARIPFMRSPELARDTTKSIDTIMDAVEKLKEQGEEYDILVLLQPTQPLRTKEDIDGAIEMFSEVERDVVSVSKVKEHPILMRYITKEGMKNLLDTGSSVRRQDMDTVYKVNGCVYVNDIKRISYQTSLNDNPVPYLMPQSRSVDIDENEDLLLAELYLNLKEYEYDE